MTKLSTIYKLTNREDEIIDLINKGMKNKKIADTLFISEATVKKHVYNIYIKLEINSRFELWNIIKDVYNPDNISKAC